MDRKEIYFTNIPASSKKHQQKFHMAASLFCAAVQFYNCQHMWTMVIKHMAIVHCITIYGVFYCKLSCIIANYHS